MSKSHIIVQHYLVRVIVLQINIYIISSVQTISAYDKFAFSFVRCIHL
jgi:hypothetical protein